MGRKRTRVDYRQLYKDYYHIEFSRDMVVHHIDFDRTNNNIDNLLLLPNHLHAKYHYVLQVMTGIDMSWSLNDKMKLDDLNTFNNYPYWLRKMAEVLEEIRPWYRMKVDFEIWPREVFASVYHTSCVITPDWMR